MDLIQCRFLEEEFEQFVLMIYVKVWIFLVYIKLLLSVDPLPFLS